MNKREAEVARLELTREKAILKELEEQYKAALDTINERIRLYQADELTQSQIYRREYQKTLKKQVEAILDKLQADEYTSVQQYLRDAYSTGFVGTMYDLHGQDVPLILPIDQESAAKAIVLDSKLSEPMYDSMGLDVKAMKKSIRQEVTRGIASGMSYQDIARNIANATRAPLSRAKTIARTEAHRIAEASSEDARQLAKSKGADVVKQWDATLDGDTRDTHRQLDGQIREVNEPFTVGTKSAMHPGEFGDPAEDCNCRCVALTRARAALDEDELEELKKRAEFFGLDKTESFNDFKKKYLKAAETLDNKGKSGIMEIGKTEHASSRMAERSVSDSDVEEARNNPIHMKSIVTDEQGRKSQVYIGKNATICVNPDTGQLITAWKTGTKIRKKYGGDD